MAKVLEMGAFPVLTKKFKPLIKLKIIGISKNC